MPNPMKVSLDPRDVAQRFGKPLLSIVTLCLNNHADVEKTARSFRPGPLIEWVVVDGGSNHYELQQIKRICKARGGRILLGPDSGIFNGMNRSVNYLNGEFILFLNSGDCFAPENDLDSTLNLLKTENPNWMMGNAWGVDGDVRLWSWPIPSPLRLYLGINSYCHQSTIFSRFALDVIGEYDEDSVFSDWSPTIKLQKLFGPPQHVQSLNILFQTGGVSSLMPLKYWVSESSRLRVKLGVHFLRNAHADKILQRLVGLYMRTRLGKRFRTFPE